MQPKTPAPSGQPDPASTPHIHVYTFGLLHLEWVDQHSGCAAPIPQEKLSIKDGMAALWLLKLLLSQPHRYALRDEIMEYFWPEASSTAAAKRLDNVVYALRKLLRSPGSPQLLQLVQGHSANGNGYQLAGYPHIWVDADSFTWHVEQAARMERFGDESVSLWEAACHLAARGTYLADERYSEWAKQRRASLEGQYRQCVHRLAALYRQQGNTTLAELRLRTYWQAHPTDEDALRPLLELFGEQERYQEAQACYQHLLTALQEEGRDPDVRTQDIAEYLRTKQIRRQRARAHPSAVEQAAIIRKESSLPVASYVSAESGVLVPASAFVLSRTALEGADSPTVLGEQTMRLMQAIMRWHVQAVSCDHLQDLLNQELGRWNTMSRSNQELLISRRTALATLLAMPLALVTAILGGQCSPLVLEQFLLECDTSLTAGWHLMMGNGLTAVAAQLPKYLPALEILAQQPSRYQKTAANLAAQGYFLMDLVALHNLNFPLREVYCQRAERYSRIAEDQALSLTAMMKLGHTFYVENHLDKALYVYEEALAIISDPHHQVSPILQSKVFSQAAEAYAQNGQVQDALRCLGKAREVPLEQAHNEPTYLSTDWGMFSALSRAGQTYEHLGRLAVQQGLSKRPRFLYTEAQKTLAQVEKLDPGILVPERIHVEIINHQAATAIALGDMETFQTYFQAGAQRANILGSKKRKQEAVANWRVACKAWPGEGKILKLADVLMEP